MKTRMQPIGNIWSKLPRVVRDLATACGKMVRIEMEGKETELDKTIIEAIRDPLTHIVRNSVDHGIEKPADRKARGKPETGCLSLRAYHEGGQVNIEISDDGKGLDTERIRAKAVSKGMLSADQAARMADHELHNLVFAAGFSTAEAVTNISGRGVGMDVVRSNIEKIGGSIDLQSKPGLGITIKIRIPLTLAIIPGLIVTHGHDRYAIPQVSLLELVRLDGAEANTKIERIHDSPVYRLRGNLLPLVYLDRVLDGAGWKKSATENAPTEAERTEAVNIVVLQADDRQFGLVVEAIQDTEEIVVKPLSKLLKGIPAFAGATIMGDGRVALILDVMGIAQVAGVISEVHDRGRSTTTEEHHNVDEDVQTLLLFMQGDSGRIAVPLQRVDRLEEFSRDLIEKNGECEVVQYRGEIMPLVDIDDLLHDRRKHQKRNDAPIGLARSEKAQVVVFTENGRSVGLVVSRILDIVHERITSRRPASRVGVLESVVVQGRVTELLDIQRVVGSPSAKRVESPADELVEA